MGWQAALRTVVVSPRRADGPLRNGAALRGVVAVAVRGGCTFCEKALRVQAEGAAAIIFVNTDDEVFTVAEGDGEEEAASAIRVPIVLIRKRDGARLLAPAASAAQRPTVSIQYERRDDTDSEEEEESESDGSEYSSEEADAGPPAHFR